MMSILSADGLSGEIAACRRLVNDQDACETEAAVVDLADENDRLRAERDELVKVLDEIETYAREDEMVTPGVTRLARAIERASEVRWSLRGAP